MHIEEAETEPLQPRIKPVAQIGDNLTLRQPGGGQIVGVSQHGPQQRLRDDGRGKGDDYLQGRPPGGRRPAQRVLRRPLRGIQRVADDIDDDAQQLQTNQPEQEQDHAQAQGKQEIRPILPRQASQPPHEFPGGVLAAGFDAGRWRRHWTVAMFGCGAASLPPAVTIFVAAGKSKAICG